MGADEAPFSLNWINKLQHAKLRLGTANYHTLTLTHAVNLHPVVVRKHCLMVTALKENEIAPKLHLNLHALWSTLLKQGPSLGYHPNSAKTWLIVKEDNLDQATNIFGSSGVNITFSGQKHLGAALGSTEFVKKYVKKKIGECCEEVTAYLPLQKGNHKLHTLPSYME